MSKLTHALIAGVLGLGLAGAAFADDMTKADKKAADAGFDATVEKAKADYKVAKKRCDALAGNDKDVCMQEAKAQEQKTRADAKARKESSQAGAEAREDKREADYKVAKEKCDALSDAAKDRCLDDAKARFKGKS